MASQSGARQYPTNAASRLDSPFAIIPSRPLNRSTSAMPADRTRDVNVFA